MEGSDKWTGLVLSVLAEGPRRYAEIGDTVAALGDKMRTEPPRTLERDGLVARTVTAQVPVRVDYAITRLGASLMPVLRSVCEWAEANTDEVLTARENFGTENTIRSGNAVRS
ncbi:winged helix-turn-helix transcriptional regulator [Nocardia sp. IFM 10818]